jgi:hypothetical protein
MDFLSDVMTDRRFRVLAIHHRGTNARLPHARPPFLSATGASQTTQKAIVAQNKLCPPEHLQKQEKVDMWSDI